MKTHADRVLLAPAAPGHDTEAGFTNSVPHYTRNWYSPDPGLVREGKGSQSLTRETLQGTRDVSTVAPAHKIWAERGAWLAAARFQGREESQRIRDAKTRKDALRDPKLTLAQSDFLGGRSPPEPGRDARLQSWELQSHPFY